MIDKLEMVDIGGGMKRYPTNKDIMDKMNEIITIINNHKNHKMCDYNRNKVCQELDCSANCFK